MSISKIYIQDKNGNAIGTIDKPVTIKGNANIDIQQTSDTSVAINVGDVENIYEGGYKAILSDYKYISSINTVTPKYDGMFWITGDKCFAWKVSSEKVHTNIRNINNILVYNEELGGGITIYDLCPACSSCDDVVRLKRQLEWCKIAINAIKDICIYPNDIAQLRRDYLIHNKIQVSATCSDALNFMDDKYVTDFNIKSIQLIMQYATMVHMWNYVVSQNNTETEITTAAEDTAGFVIQTKRALPNCYTPSIAPATIQCTIDIDADDVESDDLSAYVPRPVIEFLPFSGHGNVSTDYYNLTVDEHNAVHKTFETTINPVQDAGTYAITLKMLPFRYTVMLDVKGHPIDLSDPTYEAIIEIGEEEENTNEEDENTNEEDNDNENLDEDQTENETQDEFLTEIVKLGCTRATQILFNPTLRDYTIARSYPSRTTEGFNRWKITITWAFTGSLEKTFVNTYYFETSRCRTFVRGLLRDSTYKVYPEEQ